MIVTRGMGIGGNGTIAAFGFAIDLTVVAPVSLRQLSFTLFVRSNHSFRVYT